MGKKAGSERKDGHLPATLANYETTMLNNYKNPMLDAVTFLTTEPKKSRK